MRKALIAASLLLPLAAVAAGTSYPFLSHGVDLAKFNQCQAAISKCPTTGPVKDAQCVTKALGDNAAACDQLSQLAKVTSVDASLMSAEAMGNLTLLTLHYPADGKDLYSVVTSDGQLINMNADPRTIDPALAEKYKNQMIFTTALGKPTYQKIATGAQQIVLNVKLTEKCLACQSIGNAKINFNFDASGKFIAAQVIQEK